MAKHKTAAQRREALLQKKIEKRNARKASDWEDVLDEQLVKIGVRGGFCRLLTCDSTNNYLKSIAQALIAQANPSSILKAPTFEQNFDEWLLRAMLPKELPYLVIADEQTAGRGRQNNTWWTGRGALAASMLLAVKEYGLTPQLYAPLSLGIGYAVMRALQILVDEMSVPSQKIEIRWPNDVYVNDRKITGVLIESPNMHHLVIGVGVNTNNTADDAPEEIRDKIATLSDLLCQKIDQSRFICLLCREILAILEYFPSQIPQLIGTVEQNLRQVGKIVNIVRENEQITGKCLGLNNDGSLRDLTDSGEKNVFSGVMLTIEN